MTRKPAPRAVVDTRADLPRPRLAPGRGRVRPVPEASDPHDVDAEENASLVADALTFAGVAIALPLGALGAVAWFLPALLGSIADALS